MRRFLFATGLILILVAIATPVLAGGGGCHRASSASTTDTVKLVENCFEADIARIEVGDTVTWTNVDSWRHNIFSRSFTGSSSLEWGDTFAHTFDTAGVFPYVCTIHPGMVGAIVVGEAAPAKVATANVAIGTPTAPIATSDGPTGWMVSLALLGGGLGLGVLTTSLRNRTDQAVGEKG